MRIYIIRHGETQWNKIHRLQGRSDTDLNENGRALAMETAKGMRNIPFDLAFTSPLSRAKETAKLVLAGRDIPIIEDERLAEISFGANEGREWTGGSVVAPSCREGGRPDEAAPDARSFPKRDDPIYNFFRRPQDYVPAPGGETLQELAARTADFLQDICGREELRDKTILVSTHGAAARGLLNSMRTYELRDFWHRGVAPNCGVAILECTDGRPVLLQENVVYYQTAKR